MDNTNTQSIESSYHQPELRCYGNIQKLTQQLGTTGKNDPGGSSQTKTGA
jgi:hypothetical protein